MSAWRIHRGRWIQDDGEVLRVGLHWPPFPGTAATTPFERPSSMRELACDEADALDALWGLPAATPIKRKPGYLRATHAGPDRPIHLFSNGRGQVLLVANVRTTRASTELKWRGAHMADGQVRLVVDTAIPEMVELLVQQAITLGAGIPDPELPPWPTLEMFNGMAWHKRGHHWVHSGMSATVPLHWPTPSGLAVVSKSHQMSPSPRLLVLSVLEEARRLDTGAIPRFGGPGEYLHDLDVEGVRIKARVRRDRCALALAVPDHITARKGKGDTGNPILDRFVSSEGVPESATGHILELVHEHGGSLDAGLARVKCPTPRLEQTLNTLVELAGLCGPASTPLEDAHVMLTPKQRPARKGTRWEVRGGRWAKLVPSRSLVRVPLFWPLHPEAPSDLRKRQVRDHVYRSMQAGAVDAAVAHADALDALWEMPRPKPFETDPPASCVTLKRGSVEVELTVRRDGRVLMGAAVRGGVWAERGRGTTGHLILDRFLRSEGIPEAAVGPVLAIVHEQAGHLRNGFAQVHWEGIDWRIGTRHMLDLAEALAP